MIETFENRKTPISMESAVFENEFLGDPMHQTRWKSFLKKKKGSHPDSNGRGYGAYKDLCASST